MAPVNLIFGFLQLQMNLCTNAVMRSSLVRLLWLETLMIWDNPVLSGVAFDSFEFVSSTANAVVGRIPCRPFCF